MSSRMKWCCRVFEDCYQEAGFRGIAVLVDRNSDGTRRFDLQFRVADEGSEATVHSDDPDVLVSLLTQMQIQYCPWCGCKLSRWYRRQIDSLTRMDKISLAEAE